MFKFLKDIRINSNHFSWHTKHRIQRIFADGHIDTKIKDHFHVNSLKKKRSSPKINGGFLLKVLRRGCEAIFILSICAKRIRYGEGIRVSSLRKKTV
jgi:hypothetical protein